MNQDNISALYETSSFKNSNKGLSLYKKWYNEQPSRVFRAEHKDYSFDDCCSIIHKRLISLPGFVAWCKKYQKGSLLYIPGSNGASSFKITPLLNDYIKPMLGLPFIRHGSMITWKDHEVPLIREIGVFASLSQKHRYLVSGHLITQILNHTLPSFKHKALFIKAIITVYYSESNFQISIHNGYPNFGESFYSSNTNSALGQPDSTAFGLGQWLGNRLLDFHYFVIERLSSIGDPRLIGPEICYHPSFHIAFMAFELRSDGYYLNKILKLIKNIRSDDPVVIHSDLVKIVLTSFQGIPKDDPQFLPSVKIQREAAMKDSLGRTQYSDLDLTFSNFL